MRLVEHGRGPPVLLLHGNPDSADLWAGVIARLSPRFRCLAPDLPGFGRSRAPRDLDRTPDGMARFVAALLAAAGVDEPVHLVVHDFGGPYGLAWAVLHPARVGRIAVINSVFHADYRGHLWARIWRTPLLGELAMALLTRRGFARELRRGSPGLDPAYVRHAHALFTPAVRREVLRLYRAFDPKELAAGGGAESSSPRPWGGPCAGRGSRTAPGRLWGPYARAPRPACYPIEAVALWRAGELRPLCVFNAERLPYDAEFTENLVRT